MLKRPLNERFESAVLAGRKTTTIRSKPWPVGVPIMLYVWSGLPYRSPQRDVAAIEVVTVSPIKMYHRACWGMLYEYDIFMSRFLHETEGFASRDELDAWFSQRVKRGAFVEQSLMTFRLLR